MSTIAAIFESMEYGPVPESSAPARRWLEEHGGSFGLFIGGAWREPRSGESFETLDPATGRTLARVAQAGEADVDAAVRAAREAFPGWSTRSGHARARYLYALARQVQKHSRLLAVLESLESGKPIRGSREIDIPRVARHFYHHAGWAQLLEHELPDQVPLGVVGQITPGSSPLLMLARKVAPALAVGNTVVLKPAECTPLTSLLFAEICQEVGLPAGVVNVLTGDGRAGALIVRHPEVDKITFAGTTEVGRSIRVATAGSGKRLSLELGGMSPFLVFEDADLDAVVEGVVDASWLDQGEACRAGSRILAQEGIAPRLADRLRARMETLRVGDPLDGAIDIGAIAAPVQRERIEGLVRQGESEGAAIWQPSWSCPEEGFYPPTLLTDVAPAATIAQEEVCGPVVVLTSFRTPAEAVELANDTRYGRAASIWTENVNLALDVALKLKAGTVWVNSANLLDAAAGFGGYRESGFGREGGREGPWEYVKPAWEAELPESREQAAPARPESADRAEDDVARGESALPPIDRTPKLYIGGRQVRPDSGYSLPVRDVRGRRIGEVGWGSRTDVRNAVEAAHRGAGWAGATGHSRAQALYHVAESLSARAPEFRARLRELNGGDAAAAAREVELSIERLFAYAAWADRWGGAVPQTPYRSVTIAVPEPLGVIGVLCPVEAPLLGFISTVAPAIALGNRVVAIPSETAPLVATDFYPVLDASDVPGGVVNIVTGRRGELAEVLAAHGDVDGVWYFGSREGSEAVERLSAGNLKRTWVDHGRPRDWTDREQGEGPEFLRQATQIKNIWIPYGE